MKKFSLILMISLLCLSVISCKETTKKTAAGSSSDSSSDSTSSSSSSSSSISATVSSGNGSCSGTTCTINKKGAAFIIKISLEDLDSSDSYLSMLTSYEDDMKLTNTTSSDYINLVGTSSSTQGGYVSATILTRDVTLCKKSYSSSKCSPSLDNGRKSSPSAQSSSWDSSVTFTIETDTSASDEDSDETDFETISNIIKMFDQDNVISPYLDLYQQLSEMFKNGN